MKKFTIGIQIQLTQWGLACQFLIFTNPPLGVVLLAEGLAVRIHLLGPGWGHLASLDDLLQGMNFL